MYSSSRPIQRLRGASQAKSETPSTIAIAPHQRLTGQRGFSLPRTSTSRQSPLLIQPKLTIGAPGDRYEQEAYRVADRIMCMPEPETAAENSLVSTKSLIQRQVDGADGGVAEAPLVVNQVLFTPGKPLDADARSYFELRFGHDFSQVRIHGDSIAAESAQAINERAFSVGRDVVFGAGEYTPEKASGQQLMAHGLTHVVQQERSHRPTIVTQSAPQTIQRQSNSELELIEAQEQYDSEQADTPKTEIQCTPKGLLREEFLARTGNVLDRLGYTPLVRSQVTYPEIHLNHIKGRRYEVQPTTAALPEISSFYTTGTFEEGSKFVEGGRSLLDCPQGMYPLEWTITSGGARKLAEGEKEHCEDYKYAFERSLLLYAESINAQAKRGKRFSGRNLEEAKARVESQLTRDVGVHPADWKNHFWCLAKKTKRRDKTSDNWHKPQEKTGHLDSLKCDFVKIEVTEEDFPNIGRHDSNEIIKGCKESVD